MDALKKHGFAITFGLSILVLLVVGYCWVYTYARQYGDLKEEVGRKARSLGRYATVAENSPERLPTKARLQALARYKEELRKAGDEAAGYLKARMRGFQTFWGEAAAPDPADFRSRYDSEIASRERKYREKFPDKTKAGQDRPVLQKRRTTFSERDLPAAMKELYVFEAVIDAAIRHEVGGLNVEFVKPLTTRPAGRPTTPRGAKAAPVQPPLYETVRARVTCRAPWIRLFPFLDALMADQTVPFEIERIVMGKSYDDLQEKLVESRSFPGKGEADAAASAGPEPPLEVLSLELRAYDWKGEPEQAPASGER